MSEIMKHEGSTDVTLRPRRQITLPLEVCELLGLQVGDRLELSVADNALVLKPRKTVALKALAEIQRLFQESGITEEELQKEGRKTRERLSHTRYGEP
jgi:AbrB family looped-hinge helix DNA binding protein